MITTVQQLKDYLGIKDATSDTLLTQLVAAADAFVLSYIDAQSITENNYVETYNGTGSNRLVLDTAFPIIAITSLMVNGMDIQPSSGYGSSGYFYDGKMVLLRNDRFPRDYRNVEISYSAGLSTVPADMAQAATYIAAQMFRRRDRIGVSSKTIGQESITFNANDLDTTSRTILNQYKKRFLSR